MTNTWQNGVSGNWNTQGDWSGNVVPTAGTTATIAANGTYTVTINTSVGVQTLTLDALGATLLDSGTLALGGVLYLEAGTVNLAGTIAGGTIVDSGSDLVPSGGTLSGVVYDGTSINLTNANQVLNLANGSSIRNGSGSGPGTISLSGGYNEYLVLDGNATFDNATVDLASEYANPYDYLEENGPAGAVLTLGPNAVVNVTGGAEFVTTGGAASIANQGTINVGGADGVLSINLATFSNSGIITIASGNSLDLSKTTLTNSGSITIAAGAELVVNALPPSLTGITDNGVILINTSTLTGTVEATRPGTGAVEIASGSTLDGVTWRGPLTLFEQQVNVIGGLTLETGSGGSPGSVSFTYGFDVLNVLDSETLDNATLNFNSSSPDLYDSADSGTTLTLGSGLIVEQTSGGSFLGGDEAGYPFDYRDTLVNTGSIIVGGGHLIIDYGQVLNSGTITVGSGAVLKFNVASSTSGTLELDCGTIDGNATTIAPGGTLVGFGTVIPALIDYGVIIASGGTLYLEHGDPGTGSGLIEAGATLELGGIFGEGITFDPSGPAVLALDEPGDFTGTITGLAGGDMLDFIGAVPSNTTLVGSELEVTIGHTTYNYALAAALAGDTASIVGNNVLISQTACYCRGTRILTEAGEKPVEELVIGEKLVTRTGEIRALRWIGRRHYAGRFAARNPDILPVRIRAGALDDDIPHRDLLVSPLHAMYLDGVLVPAIRLVNGVSIIQLHRVEEVEYFHLELDSHEVILAEGAPAESFVDDDSRMMFHNAAEYAILYPHASRQPALYCAPRVTDGYALVAILRRLAIRAGIGVACERRTLRGFVDRVGREVVEGWAQTSEQPEIPVCLDVLVAGVVVAQTLANRYRSDLCAAGLGSGRHGFLVRLAAPLSDAQRRRVEVRRALDLRTLPHHRADWRAA